MSTLHLERDLAALRAAAEAEIDRRADDVANTEITPGARQALTYEEKLRQAQIVDAQRANIGALNASDFPLLQVDMDLESLTLEQAADQVLARYAAWTGMAVAIEKKRRGQKLLVKQSTDPMEIESAPAEMSLAAVLALMTP